MEMPFGRRHESGKRFIAFKTLCSSWDKLVDDDLSAVGDV